MANRNTRDKPAPAEATTRDGAETTLRWPERTLAVRRLEVLALAALLVALLVWWFDWNMLKPWVERKVEAQTGRTFHIDGDLDVDLSMTPLVTLERVRFGNLPGAKDKDMATSDKVQFHLRLLPLLRGEVELPTLSLARPYLLLERDAKGRGNWVLNGDPIDPEDLPHIEAMRVDDGKLDFRDPARRTNLAVAFRSGAPDKDARVAPLLIDGAGRYVGNAFKVDGRIDSPLVLANQQRPYRIDLRANAGPTHATAKGYLLGPLQMRGMNLAFGLTGPDMGLLFPLIGVAIPTTPPYRLMGQLSRKGRTWHYDDFKGVLGDSDVAGDAAVTSAGAGRTVPFLKADVLSRRLDFDDLAGFVGAPPQTGSKETASAEQHKQAAELRTKSKVLPDEPFDLAKLRGMDADVHWKATRVNAPKLPIEAMDMHLFVDDAVMRLAPLDLGVAGGHITSTIRMDARRDTIATRADIRASGMSLPRLFPAADLTDTSVGRVGGRLNLTAEGNSIARMAATADGDVGAVMGRGRISNLLMEYAGIDIAESIRFLLTKDRTIPIRCAYADFGVKQGVATSRQMAFDTDDTVIHGTGTIDLRDERLDLLLKPLPKDFSLLSLRAPLRVDGTFKDPDFHPDVKVITLRGAAAAILGSIAPPLALIAVVETGPGKDTNCGAGTGVATKR
ncbi:MAG: AsmA family protein [Arenimonas sp.]